jgi:diguanylate cyclase (GGDEF)-like protein/PAS domain S-box-containing protein
MPPDSPYPAPFDASTFIVPAEWHAFSDLLGGADTGMLLLREGVVVHMNSQLADQLGFAEDELSGQPVESLFPPGNGQPVAGGEGANIHLLTKAGKPIQFHFIANRIDTQTDARFTIWVLEPVAIPGSETLLQAATRLQTIVEYLPELVLVCDPDSRLTYTNKTFDELVGPRGEDLTALVHLEDRTKLRAALEQIVGSPDAVATPIAFRLKQKDGSWRHVNGHARNLLSHPEVGGLLLDASDTTEQALRQQHLATDKKRQLHYINRLLRLAQHPHANLMSALKVLTKASTKVLGTHRCAYWEVGDEPAAMRCVMAYDDIRQNFVDEVQDPAAAIVFHEFVQQVLRGDHQVTVANVDQDPRVAVYCEYFHIAGIKALMIVPVHREDNIRGVLVFSHTGQPRQWRKEEAEFAAHAAAQASQIFAQVQHVKTESQLRRLAHHDSLTGLPNRHFLFDQTADIFQEVSTRSASLAAFFIDLDGFKHVNDSLGHAVGDELLKAAAMRLKNVVRKDDILVRLGGDEFVLLARNLTDMRIADDIAMQIVESMRNTFVLQGRELQISASVGIAIYPFDGTDIDTLMKKADIAMYHAKAAGRDQYQMFEPKLSEGIAHRSTLERELRRAIQEQELQHYYQPQIDLNTGKVRCIEALLRWRHPIRGLLLPASFLQVAEESGLIHHISKWVLNDACNQLRQWEEHGLNGFNLAINLSASQLMDRTLLTALESALDRTGVPSSRLEWEVKESTVMQHNTMTSSMLDRITDMEIKLSIDDFGTGYSNMAYLRRYPVRKVKIDSGFVDGLPGEGDDCAITEAIIKMAQPLGLEVVAEGVETSQQMEYLREHGCGMGQGYFFTQPLTAEQFEKWLIRH